MPTRQLFQGLLQASRPSDAVFENQYGLQPLPITKRQTFAGWDDDDTVPPAAWFDNAAETLNPSNGWVLVDHETWPMSTQAERLETADKFAATYHGLKSRRPDLKFGFYAFAPIRDFFRARELPGHPDYLAWQTENDDMAAMAAVADAFFPSLYHFYTIATDGPDANLGVQDYFEQNIAEAKRLRATYGNTAQSIYPYIWWRRHDAADLLDAPVWALMIDIAVGHADGCVLWGGHQETWSNTDAWWQTFRERLPKIRQAGAQATVKPAAGQWGR